MFVIGFTFTIDKSQVSPFGMTRVHSGETMVLLGAVKLVTIDQTILTSTPMFNIDDYIIFFKLGLIHS